MLPLLVRALVQQGKAQRAIQDYGAIQLNKPTAAAELKTAIAIAYAQQGDNAKAQAALDDALRAAPDFAPALLVQARLKVAANDVDGALALLDRIIAKDPTNYEALQLKGDLLFVVKGDADAALQCNARRWLRDRTGCRRRRASSKSCSRGGIWRQPKSKSNR